MKRSSLAPWFVSIVASAAVAETLPTMPPVAPLRCRLSPAARLLLRYSRGEVDLTGVWTRSAVRQVKSAVRPGLKTGDRRINDVERDLVQVRNSPQSPATTQSEASVAAFGRNVVVGYNDSAALNSMARSMNGYSFSNDGGFTWTDGGGVPSGPGTVSVGDPSVVVNRNGVFYYASIVLDYNGADGGRGVVGVSRSTDGGRTFGAPVAVNPTIPPLSGRPGRSNEITETVSDKEFMAVDTSGGPRAGALYVAWNQYASTTYPSGLRSTTSQIMMARSRDGGATWSSPVAISSVHTQSEYYGSSAGSYVSGAAPAVGPNGEVYCAWEETQASTPTAKQYVSRSDNGGDSFALAGRIAASVNSIGNPTEGVVSGPARINEFPSIGVHPKTGAVYMCFASAPTMFPGDPSDSRGADRSNVYLTRSVDKGQTWSQPVRLNDDTTLNDQFFPELAVSASGVVGVMWYDRRNDPYNQRFDVYLAQSSDGGRTFTANRRVSTVSSPLPQTNPNFDSTIADNYIGDYNGIAAAGSTFHIAWGDNRDVLNTVSYGPRPDPNVYYASVTVLAR